MKRAFRIWWSWVPWLVPAVALARADPVGAPTVQDPDAVQRAEDAFRKAQDDLRKIKSALDYHARTSGWYRALSLSASLYIANSSSVVGRQDGVTLGLGGGLTGQLQYRRGLDEWVSRIAAELQYTRTPGFDVLVKSLDLFRFESFYTRSFGPVPELGVYVGLIIDTALFPNQDIRRNAVDYALHELNGTVQIVHSDRQRLTSGFAPFFFTQSVGLSYRAFDSRELQLTFHAGPALQEAWVLNGYAVTDNRETPEVEVRRLQDYVQFGAATRLNVEGNVGEWLTYRISVEVLFPLYSKLEVAATPGREAVTVDLSFRLGFKLASWASLDYFFGARHYPLLTDDLQVWNALVVSFTLRPFE